MDRITTALLAEFAKEHDLTSRDELKRFEHFASYITVRQQFSGTFDTSDIVVGEGNDTGIDAIAIVVNGSIVADIDTFAELADAGDNLDVTFVFVQSDRSPAFEASKIGNFGYGVEDFFKENPTLPRNDAIKNAAAIMNAIYLQSGKFKRGNPICRLFYVTTGKWHADSAPEARRKSVIENLISTGYFSSVDFTCVGADNIQKLYNQTRNAIEGTFTFSSRVDVQDIPGVKQAYLGFIPVSQFLPLITNDSREIIRSIFYDNVRDWQSYNDVNNEMRRTLQSDHKSRFILMNNGVTIIARDLRTTGSRFHIEDYQIVNGCQTSHVLYHERGLIDDSVQIPLRLICTQDESVIESIIRATNRQTEVTTEQFAAITDFAKKLEEFFKALPALNRLYYERRSCQYDRLSIEKTRIITQQNMVRAFAGMFLEEPHRTLRSYKALTDRLGKDIYAPAHNLEPYYAAAFALYKIEYMFRNGKVDVKYKSARFQILLAARYLIDNDKFPPMSSREAENRSKAIVEYLSDATKAEDLFANAVKVIDEVAKGNLDRDHIHRQPFTDDLVKNLRTKKLFA